MYIMKVKIPIGTILLLCFVTTSCISNFTPTHLYIALRSPELTKSSSTQSSITLKWATEVTNNVSDFIDPTLHFQLVYSHKYSKLQFPFLKWNNSEHFFELIGEEYINDDSSSEVIENFNASQLERVDDGILMTVKDLEYPNTEYEFWCRKYDRHVLKETRFTLARTSPLPPLHPPKLDAGSFYVYPLSSSDLKRRVRVYWYRMDGYGDVRVYEEGQISAVYSGPSINLSRGFLEISISMERHTFVFRAHNEGGWSNTSSTLIVPAHKDKLPAIIYDVSYDLSVGSHVVLWDPPHCIHFVTNYTVFVIDVFSEDESTGAITAYRIVDFLVVPQNLMDLRKAISVELRNVDPCAGIGLSVNSENSSSGLFILRLPSC